MNDTCPHCHQPIVIGMDQTMSRVVMDSSIPVFLKMWDPDNKVEYWLRLEPSSGMASHSVRCGWTK